MSTQARIARQLPDGTFKGVILYYDGYPSNVIPCLEFFKTEEEVEKLTSLNIKEIRINLKLTTVRKWEPYIYLKQLQRGDITFDWENLSDDHYIFDNLINLKECMSKASEDNYELGVAYTYVYMKGVWYANCPYYEIENNWYPISCFLSVLEQFQT